MKKLTKKVLPVVLAGALVAGMAMPSMAAPSGEQAEGPKEYAAVDFITAWNEDGTIKDIDMEKYAYYVAAGQALKNAPAFTNAGTVEEGRNENNLFGQIDDAYGYLCEDVWNLEKEGGDLHKEYGTWSTYWALNGDLITKQMKMVDSIAWLADTEGAEVTAKDWYVRHGSLDRDTSFSNQILLLKALEAAKADGEIDKLNFKFAYGQGHSGNYDNAEAFEFIQAEAPVAAAPAAAAVDGTVPTLGTLPTDDATSKVETVKVLYGADKKEMTVYRYSNYYLDRGASNLTSEQYENAKVNVYYTGTTASDAPVLYLVNNGGWFGNEYPIGEDALLLPYPTKVVDRKGKETIEGAYDITKDGKENLAAAALDAGYIVVDAGLRNRNMDNTNSPVTVADAKAVIKYLRAAGLGNNGLVVSGTSGGGALSAALGASGNADAYAEELKAIGAAEGNDYVTAVVAYCPITDLGHADGSYEYTYSVVRQMMLDAGYNAETTKGYIISDVTMGVSPKLAAAWAEYVNDLGVAGDNNAFDTKTLKSSGTIYDTAKAELIKCLNEGLADAGSKDAFLAELAEREVDSAYSKEAPKAPEAEKPTAPKTGNNMMPLFAVVVAAGAVALASTRRRVVR